MKIINSTYNYKYNSNQANQNKQYSKNASFGANAAEKEVTKMKYLPKLLLKAKDTRIVKGLAEKVAKSNNGIAGLLFLDSVILSSFYMFNTARNKKIKKDQKLPLIINQGLVFAVSSVGTLTIDKLLKKKVDVVKDVFKKLALKEFIDGPADVLAEETKKIGKTMKGIDTCKSLLIFGMIYRFLTPVFITPIANKMSEKIQHNNQAKKSQIAKA